MRSKNWEGKECKLILGDLSGRELEIGDKITNEDGEEYEIVGGRAPHKSSSSGFVDVKDVQGNEHHYYPSVIYAKWVPVDQPSFKTAEINSVEHLEFSVNCKMVFSKLTTGKVACTVQFNTSDNQSKGYSCQADTTDEAMSRAIAFGLDYIHAPKFG